MVQNKFEIVRIIYDIYCVESIFNIKSNEAKMVEELNQLVEA